MKRIFLLITLGLISFANGDNHKLHTKLNDDELHEFFGTTNVKHVPKYHPVTVKSHYDNKYHPIAKTHQIRIQDKIIVLKVRQDHSFISADHVIEHVYENRTEYQTLPERHRYSRGGVQNDDESHVTLHHRNDGIFGSIKTKDNFYFIHPLPERLKNEEHDHLVVSLLDLHNEHPVKKIITASKLTDQDEIEPKRVRRSSDRRKKKHMELLIAGDVKLVNYYEPKYGKDFLPSYLLATGNIVSGLYRDRSLVYPLDVVIVRTVIFRTHRFPSKDISALLNNFRKWTISDGVNNPDDSKPDHFDDAVLITKNGCDDQCELEGLAFFGQVCGSYGQCVAKDMGLVTAITAAHEIGHV